MIFDCKEAYYPVNSDYPQYDYEKLKEKIKKEISTEKNG